jgi:hypothetical protein
VDISTKKARVEDIGDKLGEAPLYCCRRRECYGKETLWVKMSAIVAGKAANQLLKILNKEG